MSDMRRLRFSLSWPPDCPQDQELVHEVITTAGGMLHDEAKVRSFHTRDVDGWVSTDGSKRTVAGIAGTLFLAHLEMGDAEFDVQFVLADVTADEPLPPSSRERFNVWHVPSGMLH